MIKNEKLGQRGEANALLLTTILLAVLFVAVAAFATWAFSSRQDYKNNTDAKIATAIAANKQVVQAADAKQYAEAAKNPLTNWSGPDSLGSVKLSYPKTWSMYLDTTDGSSPIDAYFNTNYVSNPSDNSSTYRLEVQVLTQSYDDALNQYNDKIQNGDVTATPYTLPKVPGVTGMRLDGAVFDGDNSDSVVLMPIRDKTLQLTITSSDYLSDFNNIILPNISFSP